MKKNFNLFVAALMVCVTLFVMSCGTTDKCETVNCNGNGVCVDGTCNCDAGYEGINCTTKSRDKYFGSWIVKSASCIIYDKDQKLIPSDQSNCPTGDTMVILSLAADKEFKIVNLAAFDPPTESKATVKTNNTFTTDEITVVGGDYSNKIMINSAKYYNNDSLVVAYTIYTTKSGAKFTDATITEVWKKL